MDRRSLHKSIESGQCPIGLCVYIHPVENKVLGHLVGIGRRSQWEHGKNMVEMWWDCGEDIAHRAWWEYGVIAVRFVMWVWWRVCSVVMWLVML